MAIVKTLIVKGVARFLTDAYMSTIRSGIWNGSTIQVGYGGTGVTSAKGNLYTPVFLSSSGITACSVAIPHNTKDFKINGTTYSIFTTYTGSVLPNIVAPSAYGTAGLILATNSSANGFTWVAANNHTHSLYVKLDAGAAEQTIKSSISSISDGVISLWRATEGGYPMIGFHSGTTKTKWGMLGFSAANTPIFRNTSNNNYLLAHAGNITNNNTSVTWNTETTIATIAGVAIKVKIPANPNTDHYVYQSESTTTSYRGIVLGYTSVAGAADSLTTATTQQVYLTNNLRVQPSTGNIVSNGGASFGNNIIMSDSKGITSSTLTDAEGFLMLEYISGNILGAFGDGTTATIPTYVRSTGNNLYHRIGKSSSYTDYLIADAANISNNATTIGTSLTTIATIAGVDITVKIGSYAASNHTHSVIINGSTKTIAAPGGTAVNLGSYLPLSGGTMAGAIKRYYSAASNDPMIALTSNNQDVWLWRINQGTSASVSTSAAYGFGLKYIGTGAGDDNNLVLYADAKAGTQVAAVTINQLGKITLAGGNIVNDNITVALNTEKTIATICGVPIKLKVTGTNNVTTSAVVASSASGTTQITAAQVNPYYNLLEGEAVTRSIQFTSSNITISSTTAGAISFTAKAWAGATDSADGTAGYMPGATSANRGKYLRGDGSWIALAPSIYTGTSDAKKIKITVGGENSSEYLVPYATEAEYLNNHSSSDPATAFLNLKVKWFNLNSTVIGSSGYAGNNYGFPVSNNANGILFLGTHSANYGGQLGISSNGYIYYRFISNGTFPTTANGGSWERIAFTSDLSNTWRGIYTGGTSRVGTGTGTKAMNFVVDGNLSISYLAAGTNSGQSGNADYFTVKITANANAVGVAGYVAAPTAANNPNNVWMTNANGAPAWRAVSAPATVPTIGTSDTTLATIGGITVKAKIASYSLSNHTHYYLVNDSDSRDVVTIPTDYSAKFTFVGIKRNSTIGISNAGTYSYLIGLRGWTDHSGGGSHELAFSQDLGLFRRIATSDTAWGSWVRIADSSNVSNSAATIGTSLTTIATIAGVSITAKIPEVASHAIQLFSGAKTLAVDSWITIAAVNTLDTGTYAISISSGTLYASGVFTACGGTDVMVDEIVLHVANSTSGQTWRPYARISGNNLEMSSNEATGTERTYTVKILKLI